MTWRYESQWTQPIQLAMIHNYRYPQILGLEPNQSELLGVFVLTLISLHSKTIDKLRHNERTEYLTRLLTGGGVNDL